jgi:hypothetical protein
LRLAGRQGWWLLRLGSQALHGRAPAFAARFAHLAPQGEAGVIAVEDPDYGPVLFHADGRVAAEGREIDPARMTVTGTRDVLPRGPLERMQG